MPFLVVALFDHIVSDQKAMAVKHSTSQIFPSYDEPLIQSFGKVWSIM